ncbi:MAG: hypothetical protein WB819_17565, partial [Terriglobia bacterium]
IDNSLLEKTAKVHLVWGEAAQTYDIRQRKDLGSGKSLDATLDPWSPLLLTRSAQPLPEFRLDDPGEIKAGQTLGIIVHNDALLPEGTSRLVSIEIDDPSGKNYGIYSRNLLVRSTPFREFIPIAFNDPTGRWKIRARDVMTGQSVEKPFSVVA